MTEWHTYFPHAAFILRTILLLAGVGLLSFFSVLERIDAVFYDKISTIQQSLPDNTIVIVAIDEKSLQTLGRWPWSRSLHAELINRLQKTGSNVIGLDLLFSEPQNDPFADQLLATAIAAHGAVILPVAPVADGNVERIYLVEPLPFFRENARLGHVDIELDSDGIARRVFLKAGVEEPRWPAFGLALATQANKNIADWTDDLNEAPIKTPGRWVRSNEALIPYARQPGSFQHVSYAQVLFDDQVLASLKDKIILVGMAAVGMGTRFATPVSPLNRQPMSGVEWHANVLNMLLHNRVIHPVADYTISLISIVWVLIALLAVSILRRNITILFLLVLLSCGLFFVWLSLRFLLVWLPPSAALIGTIAIYPLWNWRRINEFMQSLFVAKAGSNAALESVGDGVITTDSHDHVIYMNKGAERIFGVTLNQIQGTLLSTILDVSKIQDGTYIMNQKAQNCLCLHSTSIQANAI